MRRRVSIATKFFLTYFVITGTALAFAGVAGYVQFKRYALEEVDHSLVNQARLAARGNRILRPAKHHRRRRGEVRRRPDPLRNADRRGRPDLHTGHPPQPSALTGPGGILGEWGGRPFPHGWLERQL